MNAETLCLETTAIDQSSYLEQAPRLSLNPKTRILDIALPDLVEHELEQPQWRVESHFIDRPHSVRVFEAGERLRVGIPGPFKSIQVTLMDGEKPLAPEFNFTGISSNAPFIIHDQTTLLAPQGGLGVWSTATARRGATARASGHRQASVL